MVVEYPHWLEFHSYRFGGPVAAMRSRSGVVHLAAGEQETVERTLVGIPDDDAWRELRRALDEAGFREWPARPEHREPHAEGDWSWWLEVRWDELRHVAGGWNEAPSGFDLVEKALFDLSEQVLP